MKVFTPEEKAADLLKRCASRAVALECQTRCANAADAMLARARATGSKVGGFTSEQLADMAAFEHRTLSAL